jgi:hypothetical protein
VPLNVLLVEYHPALLQARAAIFHRRGYRVTHCVERHSAVLACGSSHFEVAVLGPSIPIDEARRLEWDLRTVNPELKVLSVGEWDNIGLDEIHKPEFLLQLLDGLLQPAPAQKAAHRPAAHDLPASG